MAGRAKKILTVVLLLTIIAAGAGYYLWNKPHKNVAAADSIKVAAAVLYKAFITDTIVAKNNYLQKVVEVKGSVNAVTENQQGQTLVTLKTATGGAYINCTMEGDANGIKEGSEITVKGICEGIGQADADLGIPGDVYLVRCYVVK